MTGNREGLVQSWDLPLAGGSPAEVRRRWESWTGLTIDEETASVRCLTRQEWLTTRLQGP